MPDLDDHEVPGATAPASSAHYAGRRSSTRRALVTSGIVLLGVLLAIGGWAVWKYQQVATRLAPSDPGVRARTAQVLDPTNALASEDPQFILLLGVDSRPGESRDHAGTIVVLRLAPNSERVRMLSIPGHTRVKIPGHGMDKIELANALGGSALVIETVKEYTGLPVHHYIQIDFAGFAEVVDAMGGVWLDVDQAIDDPEGYVAGVSDVTHIPAGRQKLNGAEALTYVRSQVPSDTDFARVRHQRQFITALIKQALEPGRLTRLPGVAVSVAEHVKTDMSMTRLMRLAQLYQGLSDDAISSYTAPGRVGQLNGESYVFPDAEGLSGALPVIPKRRGGDTNALTLPGSAGPIRRS